MLNEWSERKANSPADPWSYNAFNPAPTSTSAPAVYSPNRNRRKKIPAQGDLFDIQNDLVKALRELSELESENPRLDTRRLRRQLQNGYKILVRYLSEHAE